MYRLIIVLFLIAFATTSEAGIFRFRQQSRQCQGGQCGVSVNVHRPPASPPVGSENDPAYQATVTRTKNGWIIGQAPAFRVQVQVGPRACGPGGCR